MPQHVHMRKTEIVPLIISLCHRSILRRAFDEVWTQLAQLTSPTKRAYSSMDEGDIDGLDTFLAQVGVDGGLNTGPHPAASLSLLQGLVAPQAAYTTVLVLGATGRVGRIVTRKLLLRGYKVGLGPKLSLVIRPSNGLIAKTISPLVPSPLQVRALVRRKEGREPGAPIEGVPAAVKVVMGDLGEMADCQEAVKGVNKVIYCAAARRWEFPFRSCHPQE